MLHWFKKKSAPRQSLQVDMHSHLLPFLDDGAKSFPDAASMITRFADLGYSKLITTPHVMSDAYRNTPEMIREKLDALRAHLREENISMNIEAAAEHYLDEALFAAIKNDEPLLTFGNRYLLFETNFLTEPLQLKEFIFHASTKGYRLILAHPERYLYLQNDLEKSEDLLARGVLFQINITSLTGYYSKPAQRAARTLIDKGWAHFLGSDCHTPQHLDLLGQAVPGRYFQKALDLPLLNNSLL